MRLKVNGAACEVTAGSSVQDLLEQLDFSPEGVAVALNLKVLPRSEWSLRRLQDGDTVEVVRAVGGG